MMKFTAVLSSKDVKGKNKYRTIVIFAKNFDEAYEKVESQQWKDEILIDFKLKG